MSVGLCPECDNRIDLGKRPHVGQKITCSECDAELEVISLDPLELDWAYSEPDDEWEDLDWEDEAEYADEEWEER